MWESPGACSFLTNQKVVVGNADKGESRRGSARRTPKSQVPGDFPGFQRINSKA